MPRKVTKSLVREVAPDRIYDSTMVSKLINRVMLDGKKQIAERLVYGGMQKAADKLKVQNPLEVFEQAFGNIRPHMETRSRRVGARGGAPDPDRLGVAEFLDALARQLTAVAGVTDSTER